MLYTTLGLLTLLHFAMGDQADVLRWQIVSPPSHNFLIVVKAESVDNYWVSDITGKLFHFQKDRWISIKPIHIANVISYTYRVMDDNFILCSVLDLDYHTHFFVYDGKKWNKYDLVVDVPVRNLFIISENDFWAFGDWGHIYHYRNGNWKKIDTPITNHVTFMEFLSDTDIWFGTRAEGIFHYDSSTFTKVEMVGYTGEDIFEIKFFDSQSGVAAGRNGNIYQYKSMKFELINTELNGQRYSDFEFYNKNLALALDGEGKLYAFQNGHWTDVALPTGVYVNHVILCSENSGIITGEKGTILVATPEKRLFFTNTAGRSYVDGSFFDKSVGAAFVDVNNDDLLDIFVLNKGQNQLNRLYLNQRNTRFLDITNMSKRHQSSQSSLFTFGDFNKDGLIDFAFWRVKTPEITINLFYNSGNGLFDGPKITHIDPIGHTVPLDLDALDFDNDGDLDLYLSFQYGPIKKKAHNILLENKIWGHFSKADSTLGFQSPGWNRTALSADFNNDGWLDIYVSNNWMSDRLLFSKGDMFIDVTEEWFQQQEESNTQGAAAVDFDNDGDLDLFLLSAKYNITVYRNEKEQYFRNITAEVGLQFDFPYLPSKECINFGDFNNDGFIDIFISNLNHQGNSNWLFLSDSGRTFVDFSEGCGLESPVVLGTVVGDVDNDGDLDIYGYSNGSNLLWINNLNDKNYLKIDSRGVGSNRTGLGNKVWVYEANHLDDVQFLRGYRQIGTDNFEPNMQNSTVTHFGLDSSKEYDVKVQFHGGRRKIVTNIKPGQTLVIYEMDGLTKFLSFLPGIIFRTLSRLSIQLYSLIVVICITMILFTVKIGKERYDWDLAMISGVLVLNLSAFWILVLLTSSESFLLKYILPLAPVLLGTLIPIGISHRVQFLRAALSHDSLQQNELLKQLLIFSHGQWAMKNLNGLQFLSENALSKHILEEQLIKQLNERVKTFLEMTKSNLQIVINLGRRANIEPEVISSLDKNNKYLGTTLETIRKTNYSDYPLRFDNHRRISAAINQVKLDLTQVKNLVFSKFSSNVLDVIVNTTNSIEELAREKGVIIKRIKTNIDNIPVLIPSHELASILDNTIRNAIVAVDGREKKVITIRVYKYQPAIKIDIKDTGIGIPQGEWDRIFESGYSRFGSTGNGLAQSREILNKYGSRIFVKDSQVDGGSTFTIELKEGKKIQ